MFFTVLVVLSLLSIGYSDDVMGAVSLNSGSFDKVISKFKFSLVKLDEAYPYGEKLDAYKEFAKNSKSQPELLVASVGVKDYGDKENQDLADRFGLKKDDFPKYMLFINGESDPIIHEGGWKAADLTRFVVEKTGLWMSLPDCLESFDKLVGEFVAASGKAQTDVIERAQREAEALKDESERKSATVYVKTMRKIAEKGPEYVKSEIERVEKLKDGKVGEKKKKQFEQRLNILSSVSMKLKEEL